MGKYIVYMYGDEQDTFSTLEDALAYIKNDNIPIDDVSDEDNVKIVHIDVEYKVNVLLSVEEIVDNEVEIELDDDDEDFDDEEDDDD